MDSTDRPPGQSPSAQPEPGTERGDRFDSWKEIAAYLKRDIRTVQRWEKSQGLPVHRHIHTRRASPYAYRSELDEWWQARRPELPRDARRTEVQDPAPSAGNAESIPAARVWPRSWRMWSIAVLVALLAVVAVSTRQRSGLVRSAPADHLLAVTGFRDLHSPRDPVAAEGLASLVGVGVLEASACRVVAPEHLEVLRGRRWTGQGAPGSDEEVLHLARSAHATLILCGDIGESSGRKYVAWRLLDVESGRAIGGQRDEDEELLALADRIINGVVALIEESTRGAVGEAPPSVAQITTTSSKAYELYIAGRQAADEGQTLDAVRLLEKAVALDSTFALAHFALSNVRWPTWEEEVAVGHIENAWRFREHLGAKDFLRVEARRHELHDRMSNATRTYRRILERWPDDRDAVIAAARGLQYFWFDRDALAMAEAGLARYPDDPDLNSVYGASLASNGRLEEAVQAARRSVAGRPDDPLLYDSLGRWLLALGSPDSAQAVFQSVQQRDPQAWWAQEGLALCAYAHGELEAAIELERAILDRPDVAAGDRISVLTGPDGFGLCGFYVDAGRIREALEAVERARELAPRAGPLSERRFATLRQIVLTKACRASESLAIVQEWTARKDLPTHDRWEMEAQRTAALICADSVVQARESIMRLRHAEPFEFAAHHLRTYLLAAAVENAAGNPDSAIAQLNRAQLHGVPPLGTFDLQRRLATARAHRLAGRREEAVAECRRGLAIYGSSPLLYRELAEIEEERGRLTTAVDLYRKLLHLWSRADPELPQVTLTRLRSERLQQRLAGRTDGGN